MKKGAKGIRILLFVMCIIGMIITLCTAFFDIDSLKTENIDLHSDEVRGGIPLFLQADDRWGNKMYGDDCMAVTGCGPTCLAMVRCGLGNDRKWDPYRVAQLAEKKGLYIEGKGSSWELMTEGASALGLISEEVIFNKVHIIRVLEAGKPIICAMRPGDFTTEGHFIVLVGIDSSGEIVVNDPNSQDNSDKTWDIDTIMGQTKNLWAYTLDKE